MHEEGTTTKPHDQPNQDQRYVAQPRSQKKSLGCCPCCIPMCCICGTNIHISLAFLSLSMIIAGIATISHFYIHSEAWQYFGIVAHISAWILAIINSIFPCSFLVSLCKRIEEPIKRTLVGIFFIYYIYFRTRL